jgi:hypothetical protein
VRSGPPRSRAGPADRSHHGHDDREPPASAGWEGTPNATWAQPLCCSGVTLARHNGSAGACSSAGQSSCLLSSRPGVRIPPGALISPTTWENMSIAWLPQDTCSTGSRSRPLSQDISGNWLYLRKRAPAVSAAGSYSALAADNWITPRVAADQTADADRLGSSAAEEHLGADRQCRGPVGDERSRGCPRWSGTTWRGGPGEQEACAAPDLPLLLRCPHDGRSTSSR